MDIYLPVLVFVRRRRNDGLPFPFYARPSSCVGLTEELIEQFRVPIDDVRCHPGSLAMLGVIVKEWNVLLVPRVTGRFARLYRRRGQVGIWAELSEGWVTRSWKFRLFMRTNHCGWRVPLLRNQSMSASSQHAIEGK